MGHPERKEIYYPDVIRRLADGVQGILRSAQNDTNLLCFDNMIYIVVPAYNEARQIGRVVRGLFEHGFTRVVVVDDGSEDRTADEARTAGAVVLRHLFNRGQGAALATGNAYCRRSGAEVVVHFDGDGQFDPADIQPALVLLRESGADMVLGSRFLDGRSQIPGLKRYVILPLARHLNFLLTGLRLTDAHNGFRILGLRALTEIKISQAGMAHNSEITGQIKKLKLSFRECPVKVTYTRYGQGIAGGLKILWDMVVGRFLD